MSPEEPQRSPHRHHTAARRRRFTEPTAHASTQQGRPGNIDLTISLLTRLVQGHDPDRILTEVLAYQGDILPWGARAMSVGSSSADSEFVKDIFTRLTRKHKRPPPPNLNKSTSWMTDYELDLEDSVEESLTLSEEDYDEDSNVSEEDVLASATEMQRKQSESLLAVIECFGRIKKQTEVVSKAAKACLEAISGESPDRRRDRRRRGLAANQAACTEAKRVRIGASLMQRAKEREMAQLKERLGRLMETYETKFGQYVAIMTELNVHSQRDCYADKRLEIYEEMALEDEPLLMDALADAISFTNLARNAYLLSAFKKIAALYGRMRPHAEAIRSIREGKMLTALRTQTEIDEDAIAHDGTLEGEDTEVDSAATSMLTSAVGGSQIGVDEQEDPSTPVEDDPIVTPSNRSDSDEPYTPRENLHMTTSSGSDSEEPKTSIGDHNSTTPSIENGVGEEPVPSQDRPITTSSSLSGVDEPSTSPREHSINTQSSGSDIEEPLSSHGDRIVITQSSRGGIENPLTSGEDGLIITTTPSNQSGVDEPSSALGQDYPHQSGVDGITSQLSQSGGDDLSVSSRYSSSSSTPSESSSDESCGFLQDDILITSLGPTMVGEADWPSSVPGGSHSTSRPVEKVSSDDEQKKLEAHKKSLNKTVKRMRSMLNLVVETIASAEIEDVILAEQETNLDAASECNAYITYARCLLQREEGEAERRLLDAELSDAELSDAASDTSRPGMIRSDTGRSDRSSPEMLRSDTSRTDSSRPDMLRSDTGRSDRSSPEMLRSDTGRTDSSRPDMLRSDTGRSDRSSPDMLRSDTSRTDSSRPDMLRSDTGRTDSSRPDMLRSDTGRTDSSQPDMLRSDTGRTDSSRPDMLRSDTGRSDRSSPEMLRSDTGRSDRSSPEMLRSDTGRSDRSSPDMMRPDTDRLDAGTFSPTSGPNGVDSEGEQSNPSAETHSKVPPNVWLANKDALQDCESSQNQLEEATREFGSLSAAVHRRGVALTKKIQSYLWEDSEVPPDDPLAQAEEDSIEVAKNAHRETIGVVGWLSGALERIPHTPEHSWELTTTDVRDALHFLPTKVEKLVNSYVAHQDSFKEASRGDEEAAEVVLDPEGQEEAEAEEETVGEMEGNEWEEAEGDEEGIGEETPEGTDVRLASDKLPFQFEGTRPPASRAATIEPMASEEAVRARAEVRSSSYEKSKTLGEESDTFHPAQVVWLVLRGVYARLARQVGESHVGGTSGRKKKSKGAISGKKSAPTNRPSGSSTTPTAPKGGRKTRMSPREKSRRVGKASVTTSPRPTGTGRRVTQKRARPSRAGKQAALHRHSTDKIVAEEFTEEDENESAQEDETADAQEGIERIQSRGGDSGITGTDIEDDHPPEADTQDRRSKENAELGSAWVDEKEGDEEAAGSGAGNSRTRRTTGRKPARRSPANVVNARVLSRSSSPSGEGVSGDNYGPPSSPSLRFGSHGVFDLNVRGRGMAPPSPEVPQRRRRSSVNTILVAAADRLGEEINELGDFVVELQKASEVELRENFPKLRDRLKEFPPKTRMLVIEQVLKILERPSTAHEATSRRMASVIRTEWNRLKRVLMGANSAAKAKEETSRRTRGSGSFQDAASASLEEALTSMLAEAKQFPAALSEDREFLDVLRKSSAGSSILKEVSRGSTSRRPRQEKNNADSSRAESEPEETDRERELRYIRWKRRVEGMFEAIREAKRHSELRAKFAEGREPMQGLSQAEYLIARGDLSAEGKLLVPDKPRAENLQIRRESSFRSRRYRPTVPEISPERIWKAREKAYSLRRSSGTARPSLYADPNELVLLSLRSTEQPKARTASVRAVEVRKHEEILRTLPSPEIETPDESLPSSSPPPPDNSLVGTTLSTMNDKSDGHRPRPLYPPSYPHDIIAKAQACGVVYLPQLAAFLSLWQRRKRKLQKLLERRTGLSRRQIRLLLPSPRLLVTGLGLLRSLTESDLFCIADDDDSCEPLECLLAQMRDTGGAGLSTDHLSVKGLMVKSKSCASVTSRRPISRQTADDIPELSMELSLAVSSGHLVGLSPTPTAVCAPEITGEALPRTLDSTAIAFHEVKGKLLDATAKDEFAAMLFEVPAPQDGHATLERGIDTSGPKGATCRMYPKSERKEYSAPIVYSRKLPPIRIPASHSRGTHSLYNRDTTHDDREPQPRDVRNGTGVFGKREQRRGRSNELSPEIPATLGYRTGMSARPNGSRSLSKRKSAILPPVSFMRGDDNRPTRSRYKRRATSPAHIKTDEWTLGQELRPGDTPNLKEPSKRVKTVLPRLVRVEEPPPLSARSKGPLSTARTAVPTARLHNSIDSPRHSRDVASRSVRSDGLERNIHG